MATQTEIRTQVLEILRTNWSERQGLVVPEPADVKLGNDAVHLEGTVLYADLVDSTGLVNGFKPFFAAEVYKSYLMTACRLIRDNDGIVTAFDGDRVMAVFVGDNKNTSAAMAALQINYAVTKLINPAIKEVYTSTAFQLQQVVGVDTGQLFVARTGIRGANDLVWVGRAANYAAGLCGLRDAGYYTYITEDVFQKLHESVKLGGDPRRLMWEKTMWPARGIPVYKSNWWWSLPTP